MNKIALSATLLALTTSAWAAPTVGVTVTPDANSVFNNGDWILGYSFTPNSPINVVSLGVYDHESDGLSGEHEVGLWDSVGTLLASTIVPAGTGATLDSSFRFVSITSVLLNAGELYTVGATKTFDDGDPWLQDPSSLSPAPEITYESRKFEFYTGSLVEPTLEGSGSTGYFGGNFQFDTRVSTPDAGSTMVLLLAGFGAITSFRRRK